MAVIVVANSITIVQQRAPKQYPLTSPFSTVMRAGRSFWTTWIWDCRVNEMTVDIRKGMQHTKPDAKQITSLINIPSFGKFAKQNIRLNVEQTNTVAISINIRPEINECWTFPNMAFIKDSSRC